ncbi:GNAT family N-acetyltransferase [Aminobacter anthyllidis]|nr:GNAT family N-acetyltransferase [Aminobacter anthyllidis]MDH4988575.1 GNAT family N-acetyltransferase [Aminobacter anthyllidis]
MPSPQGENDVRLRRVLPGDLQPACWPTGFAMRTFQASDAVALFDLLERVFDDGMNGPFDQWWSRLEADADFDPELCFLVFDGEGRLAGAALSWTSGFLKDLAVDPAFRGKGIAEALLWHIFATFAARGVSHIDLKTNLIDNAAAVRLYVRLGMSEVDWGG